MARYSLAISPLMAKPHSSAGNCQRLLTGFFGRKYVANFMAAFRRALAAALASETIPSKASRAARLIVSGGENAAEGVLISDVAGRGRRTPPVRSGKAICATAIRMSA